MRWIPIVILILSSTLRAAAQDPGASGQMAAMAELKGMLGTWQGSGWQQRGPGPEGRSEFDIREEVESELGGLVYLVHGLGTAPSEGGGEPEVVHRALATIHWDAGENTYEFQAHTGEGHHTVTTLDRLEDGRLRWGFDVPQGTIRYTMDLSHGRWHEMGEISLDGGKTWIHFHDMTLTKAAAR